jgi:hypothetical protein
VCLNQNKPDTHVKRHRNAKIHVESGGICVE